MEDNDQFVKSLKNIYLNDDLDDCDRRVQIYNLCIRKWGNLIAPRCGEPRYSSLQEEVNEPIESHNSESKDEESDESCDIDLIMSQINVSREQATDALKKHKGDVVGAIMSLTEGDSSIVESKSVEQSKSTLLTHRNFRKNKNLLKTLNLPSDTKIVMIGVDNNIENFFTNKSYKK